MGLYIRIYFCNTGFCIVQIVGKINSVVRAGIDMCIAEINIRLIHLNRSKTH